MTTWEPERHRWLKSVGSADDPMALDWFESAPQELEVIHFARNPTSVGVDDLLVYYAAVHQKLLGIVNVFTRAQFDAQLKHWPYYVPIRVQRMIKDIHRAPDLDVLNVPDGRDFHKVVMQMDYAVLTDAEYGFSDDPSKGYELRAPTPSSPQQSSPAAIKRPASSFSAKVTATGSPWQHGSANRSTARSSTRCSKHSPRSSSSANRL